MNLGRYYSAPSTPMSQTRRLRHRVVKSYSEWDQHWDLGRPVTKSHCQTLPPPYLPASPAGSLHPFMS